MNLDVWFSWYKEILEEFSFDREMDEKSAEILKKLLEGKNSFSPQDISIKPNNNYLWSRAISQKKY